MKKAFQIKSSLIDEFLLEIGTDELENTGCGLRLLELSRLLKDCCQVKNGGFSTRMRLRVNFRKHVLSKPAEKEYHRVFEMGSIDTDEPTISEDFGNQIIVNGKGCNPMVISLEYFDDWSFYYSDGWVDVFLTHYEEEDDVIQFKESIHLLFIPKFRHNKFEAIIESSEGEGIKRLQSDEDKREEEFKQALEDRGYKVLGIEEI